MSEPLDRFTAALVGRYTIERQIGQGAMATVYLARDLRHSRRVAVKLLRPELSASIGPDRFAREIEIAAQLQHPHIVPLYDSGQVADLFYYVMPFVDGESLRERLDREKQLPIEEALGIARQVAEALAYAHGLGFVHRDIKPANILLHHGQAVVGDFGIARAVSAAGGLRLTTTGLAVGTPVYMSPEQATGNEEVDGRSDLYSLACVLFEALAGQPPFVGSSLSATMTMHLAAPVPRIRQLRAEVPKRVEAAIARGLAKAPEDRFATATDFTRKLGAPTGGDRPHLLNTWPKPRRQNLYRAAALISLVALITLGVFQLWPAPAGIDQGGRSPQASQIRVDSARRVVLALRQEAQAADAPTGADSLYQLALQAERRGDAQRTAGSLEAALATYDEAGALYEQSRLGAIQIQGAAEGGAAAAPLGGIVPSQPGPDTTTASSEDVSDSVRATVLAARTDMEGARERVPGDDDIRTMNGLYRDATRTESAGRRQYGSGAIDSARISFGQAKDLYERAAIGIGTRLRAEADSIKRIAVEARARIDSLGTTDAAYLRASALEKTADSAYDASGYLMAAEYYEQAGDMYSAIEVDPHRATRQAILRSVEQYEASIEARDIQGLRALFEPLDEAVWLGFFQTAENIQVTVDIERLDPEGENPTVDLLVNTSYVDNRSRDQGRTNRFSWIFENVNGRWIVSQIVPRD